MVLVEKLASHYNLSINSIFNSVPSLDKSLDIIMLKIDQQKQKAKIESTKSNEITLVTNNFESKITSLKEQLDNKDIHLELLRKKVTQLEEEKFGRSEIRVEFENTVKNTKKMNIKIERLTEEVRNLTAENKHLKAHILDINNLRVNFKSIT